MDFSTMLFSLPPPPSLCTIKKEKKNRITYIAALINLKKQNKKNNNCLLPFFNFALHCQNRSSFSRQTVHLRKPVEWISRKKIKRQK